MLKLNDIDSSFVLGQIQDLKRAVLHHEKEIKPNLSELEKWEQKEYEQVNKEDLAKLEKLKSHVKFNEDVFNKILDKYDHDVDSFLIQLEEK